MPKPRLKPKPDLKPKATPKPRFVEAGAGEDELFGGAAGAAKNKNIAPSVKERVPARGDQDLFDQARKSSFRFVTLIAPHLTRLFYNLKKRSEYGVRRIEPFVTVFVSCSPDSCPSWVIVLCCGVRRYTLTVPLSTEAVNRNRRSNTKSRPLVDF